MDLDFSLDGDSMIGLLFAERTNDFVSVSVIVFGCWGTVQQGLKE